MSRPLVSVITGTWQRHDLLMEAIANVREQTYPNLEHVIVSDGPDPELYNLIASLRDDRESCPHEVYSAVPIRFAELGRNLSTYLPDSFGAAPVLTGQMLARGEYQTWLADDERMTPDHIAALVEACESTGADFAYSQCRMWWVDRPQHAWVIGTDPPQCGQITNTVHRTSVLKLGLYPFRAGMTSDWELYAAWIRGGARWAYVPRVTFSHRADH